MSSARGDSKRTSSATSHSWSVDEALAVIAAAGKGVIVLLNCAEGGGDLIERVASSSKPKLAAKNDLLTYGIGAQILRDLKVRRMKLMANPRKMPSMAGWELEITGYMQPASRSNA
jgi:3,4-dihydroxy 2-butanone 4-phosphate synthase/GTP cyclohydrolase II